jgi:hypothetical protein
MCLILKSPSPDISCITVARPRNWEPACGTERSAASAKRMGVPPGNSYRGIGSEAYLNGTSQGSTPEDARQDGHIRGRSKLLMKYPG